MPEPTQPPVASKSTAGAGRRPLKLADQWHGLPVYAWVGIGAVTAAGTYLFVRRFRKAKTAATDPTSTLPAGFSGYPSGPFSGGGVTPPASPPTPPTPPPASPPHQHGPQVSTPPTATPPRFSTQDVLDIFARYNKPLDSTQGPSTETVAQRVARIVREMNDGTRTPAEVAASVQALPGSGYKAPTTAQGGVVQMGGLTSQQMASVLAMDVPTAANQAEADANLARTRAGSLALAGK